MEWTGARQRDRSRERALPRQDQRRGNAGARRHEAGAPPGARPGAAPATGDQRPARRDAERGKPALPVIIEAVEELREDLPRIGVGGLYQQFRCRGGRWALVTREDVRVALAGIERAARREFVAPGPGERPRRTAARTPHGAWPQFREAIMELHDRGADVPRIVRQLRSSGWRVSHDDVAGALRRIKAANTARPGPAGRSLPAPRQAGDGICPSCGAPITDLGLCRCS